MASLGKILIVDDNPKYLEDVLPMYGYEVEVAKDGVRGLQILGEHSKDIALVLLDVMMPNLDGWQTLKKIRDSKHYGEIPVIMITAVDEEQKQVLGLKTGADDYITKPFTLPNLLARVDALLRRSSWNKEDDKKNIEMDFVDYSEDIIPLSAKEKSVLQLAAKGASNDEIAEKLILQNSTVKSHMNKIFKKLNVKSRTQAILLAIQMNLID
jgi:DNA-binding NarL/FixJ family response regulator